MLVEKCSDVLVDLYQMKKISSIQNDLCFQNGVRLCKIRSTVLKGQNQIKYFEVIKIFLLI